MSVVKLAVQGVSKWFPDREGTVEAVRDINFDVHEREFVSIIGRSGCGKTTLLRMIAGLESVSAGNILLDKGGKLNKVDRAGSDRGMVFQDHYLFPWRTAKRNIEFGLEFKRMRRRERAQIASDYLQLVNLEKFADRYPSQLSGGMRQRIAIARALATDPEILLMDEPFAALDAQTRSFFQDELLRIWGVTRKTILLVTHSIEEAVYLSDRIVVLKPHPGEVSTIIKLDMPRPRDRTSAEFAERVNQLGNLLGPSNIPAGVKSP